MLAWGTLPPGQRSTPPHPTSTRPHFKRLLNLPAAPWDGELECFRLITENLPLKNVIRDQSEFIEITTQLGVIKVTLFNVHCISTGLLRNKSWKRIILLSPGHGSQD